MNLSSIPAAQSRPLRRVAVGAGAFSVRMRVPRVTGELGHHQRRRHTFARDVAHRQGHAVAGKWHEVIIVAPDFVGRLVMSEELVARDGRHALAARTSSAPARRSSDRG